MYKLLAALLTMTLLLMGCVPTLQLEKLGILSAEGLDYTNDGKLQLTAVMRQFEFDSGQSTKIVTGTGLTIKGSKKNMNEEANFNLQPAKLEVLVFGSDVAKKGMNRYFDTFTRDPMIPDTLYLAVSQSKAKDLMTVSKDKVATDMGRYIHDVIEEYGKTDGFPKVDTIKYLINLHDVGRDVILPMFELKQGVPRLTKIAIFSGDRMVGTWPIKDRYLINVLDKNAKDTTIELSIPKKEMGQLLTKSERAYEDDGNINLGLQIIKGSGKIHTKDSQNPAFDVDVDLRLALLETSEHLKLDSRKSLKVLGDKVQKHLDEKYEKLFTYLQEKNSDAFGIGDAYRAQDHSKLTEKEWRKKYPKIKVHFNVDAKIINHGEAS